MKTINEAVNERLSRINNMKRMQAEDMTEALYRKHPALRRIDSDLLDVRTSRMICSIEHDSEPLPHSTSARRTFVRREESTLKTTRSRRTSARSSHTVKDAATRAS